MLLNTMTTQVDADSCQIFEHYARIYNTHELIKSTLLDKSVITMFSLI